MWLLETFGSSYLRARQVVDVAGGRGLLAYSLWHLDGIKSTLIDPRAPTAAVEADHWAYCRTAIESGRETRGFFWREKAYARSPDAAPSILCCKFEATLFSRSVGAQGSDSTDSEIPQKQESAQCTDVVSEQQVKEEDAASKMRCARAAAMALLQAPTRPVLLGLHACAATEAIVDCALSAGLPFAVVPCCGECSNAVLCTTWFPVLKELLARHIMAMIVCTAAPCGESGGYGAFVQRLIKKAPTGVLKSATLRARAAGDFNGYDTVIWHTGQVDC